ncbi:MAG: mechanosensitive ion channel family protein [Patescibacteria group bacterium]
MPTLDQLIIAAIIVAVAIVLSPIVVRILKAGKKLTKKTKTDLDDIVIDYFARPVYFAFLLAGIIVALHYLFPNLSYKEFGYNDLIFVIVVLWAGYAVRRLLQGVLAWYEKETKGTFGFIKNLVMVFVWAVAILLLLRQFGVDVTALFAGLGIAGLAIAFALQNTLSGVFGAIVMAVDKPIRIGDRIRLSDKTEGYVEDISMRSTRIRTAQNNIVIVPNKQMADMIITNLHYPQEEVVFNVGVGVAYGSDLEHVEKVCADIANQVLANYEKVEDFEPIIRFQEFADSSINVLTIMRVKNYTDQFEAKHVFIKELYKAFEREKIQIPFPQIDVHNKKS